MQGFQKGSNEDLGTVVSKEEAYRLYQEQRRRSRLVGAAVVFNERVQQSVLWRSLLLLGNLIVISGVNIAYVLVQISSKLSIGSKIVMVIIVAMIKTSWNVYAVPRLIAAVSSAAGSDDFINWYVNIIAINNILAPCFAMAVTNPSCFYNLFFGEPPFKGTYVINECVPQLLNISTVYKPVCTEVSGVQPFEFPATFTYSFECTDQFLVNFIPLFCVSYVGLFFIGPVFSIIIAYSPNSYKERPWITKTQLYGIHWPHADQALFYKTFEPDLEVAWQMMNVLTVLTYGLMSYQLAVVVTIFSLVSSITTQVLIVRYFRHCQSHKKRDIHLSPPQLQSQSQSQSQVHVRVGGEEVVPRLSFGVDERGLSLSDRDSSPSPSPSLSSWAPSNAEQRREACRRASEHSGSGPIPRFETESEPEGELGPGSELEGCPRLLDGIATSKQFVCPESLAHEFDNVAADQHLELSLHGTWKKMQMGSTVLFIVSLSVYGARAFDIVGPKDIDAGGFVILGTVVLGVLFLRLRSYAATPKLRSTASKQ